MSHLTKQLTFTIGGLRGPGGVVTADLAALEANVVAKSADATVQAGNATTQAGVAANAANAAYDVQQELGRGPVAANLYDVLRRTLGSYIDNSGSVGAAANYVLSDPMRIKAGQQYTFGNAAATTFAYRWLALNGTTVLAHGAGFTGVSGTPIAAPANAYWLQISLQPNTDFRSMLVRGTALPASYIQAGFYDPASARAQMMTSALAQVYAMAPQIINIVDASRFVDGYAVQPANGTVYAFTGYAVSDRAVVSTDTSVTNNAIPVRASTQYIANASLTLVYFDQDGNRISQATITASTAFTTPASAAFIRFHVNPVAIKSSLMIVKGSTLPSAYLAFGYPTTTYVGDASRDAARLASAQLTAVDANLNDPSRLQYNRAVSPVNGSSYGASGYAMTVDMPVTPGDYIAASVGNNGHAFLSAPASSGGTFVSSMAAAAFTAGCAGNVLTVTTVASGTLSEGQRIAASGATARSIIRQLTSAETGGALGLTGTYLVDVKQDVAAGTAFSSTNGMMLANTWIKVPAGAYAYRTHGTPIANMRLATIRRAPASLVNRAVFTAQISGQTMTISVLSSGQPLEGDIVTGPGVEPGTFITSMPTNGGTGNYGVSVSQAVSTDTVMQAGLSPIVAAKPFGGSAGYLPKAGKNIAFLGDSITYTAGYIPYVIAATGATLAANWSRPGRQMRDALNAYDGVSTNIPLTAASFANVDTAILNLGTNDWAGSTPLGTIADASPSYAGAPGTSFYADVFRAAYQITQWNKTCQIILATPLKRGVPSGGVAGQPTYPGPNGIGLTLEQYVQAIKEVAAIFGAPVADQFLRSGINQYNIDAMSSDNLHPGTAIAHQKQAAVISGALNQG